MCQKTNFTFHFSERGRETLGTVPVKETWFLVLARGISSGDLHTGFSLLKILHRIAQPISPIGTIGLLGNWAWVTVLTARPMTQCQAKAKGRLAMGLLEKIWIARKHTNRWKHTIFYSICVASQLQFNSGASLSTPRSLPRFAINDCHQCEALGAWKPWICPLETGGTAALRQAFGWRCGNIWGSCDDFRADWFDTHIYTIDDIIHNIIYNTMCIYIYYSTIDL